MARKYAEVDGLTEIIRQPKASGEKNREIAESYGLNKYQVKAHSTTKAKETTNSSRIYTAPKDVRKRKLRVRKQNVTTKLCCCVRR